MVGGDWAAVWLSLKVASLATLTALPLAFVVAVALARGRLKEAHDLFTQAKAPMETRFGGDHFRVKELRADLAECERRLAADPAAAPPKTP